LLSLRKNTPLKVRYLEKMGFSGGTILGYFFENQFASLGQSGRLIGFFIALLYFSFLNSEKFGGQTFGKIFMKIQVVGQNGAPPKIMRTLCRSTVLIIPHFLNGLYFPAEFTYSRFSWLPSVVLFGLGGGLVYFYLFNRKTRQSLHDIICGTYVVKNFIPTEFKHLHLSKKHYVVFFCYVFILLVAPFFLKNSNFLDEDPYKLRFVYNELRAFPNTEATSVVAGKSFLVTTKTKREAHYFNVVMQFYPYPKNLKGLSTHIASSIFENYPEIFKKDIMTITIKYGYDIGIFSKLNTYASQKTPLEWKSFVEASTAKLNPSF